MSQKRNKKGHPALRVFVKTLLVILLIGGGLFTCGPDLVQNCRDFAAAVG